MTRLLAFCLSVAYAGLGYALIAWKYQHFARRGPRTRKALVALHLWIVLSNVLLFVAWVIHDYRFGSWHPVPLAGFGLFLVGTTLILWALARLRSAAFVPSAERPLTEGPYAWVRHPMYAGGVLAAFGLAYLAGSAWAFGYATVIALLLYWLSRSEEVELARRYGQAYRAYAEGKGRFVPLRRRHSCPGVEA
ncbi:MAG: isoprenylcysteine carboxylmethyltransferase family protein [Candidatus Rokubacteria bacterium]|nr:isoprenylcysteine carboxylmethyltransferase family protein [Candidatus Rokubacteria bacterium]